MTVILVGLVLVIQIIILITIANNKSSRSSVETSLSKLRDDVARLFEAEIRHLREDDLQQAKLLREELSNSFTRLFTQMSGALAQGFTSQNNQQKALFDAFSKQLATLTDMNEHKLERVRGVVEAGLAKLQEENSKKLEAMRQTVDEKLSATLEKRLSESFKQVSDRLEAVHKGLGEMQSLASNVGDLKRVLTNVKTRGTFGEVQLEMLLNQILSPEQYDKNAAKRPIRR